MTLPPTLPPSLDDIDATGLIREAYRIDGITDAECRSIFVDWALKLPAQFAPDRAITVLLETYGAGTDEHPMTQVLKQGLAPAAKPKRRGGRNGRLS